MKPLESLHEVLMWLSGIPPPESVSKRKKMLYIASTFFVIMANLLAVLSSAVFIYQNVSINLEETLFSLFHGVGCSGSLYESITIVFVRYKLSVVFENLEKIYIEYAENVPLLKETNERCERLWLMYRKYAQSGYAVNIITVAAVSTFFCYITNGYFDAKHVYHPFRLIVPWNQLTPLGYFLEICFAIIGSGAYFLSNGLLLILFISMCLHHQTFYKIFQNETKKLDDHEKHQKDADHLSKLICFHNTVKNWFLDSIEAYSVFVLIVLITDMILLACCIFQLDLQMKHPQFAVVSICLGIIAGLLILFVYCYYGKMASESFEGIADCLYKCNWLELSTKLQKYFVIMIENAQRPIYYHGFGVARLNLETFTKMIRTVCSFYMMFKTITTD